MEIVQKNVLLFFVTKLCLMYIAHLYSLIISEWCVFFAGFFNSHR